MAKLPKRIEAPPAPQGRGNLDDPQEELVDLNFRVTKSFRKAYKQAALDHDMTMRQILREAFELWKQAKGEQR
ncbi:hypothetical protein [Inquilinus sp. OTU3971]|uniref:hypothetical protein n=1 Tax=Inquilinus sp. OTU3971 TaxID=3043855 RepID=UPI00313E5F3F